MIVCDQCVGLTDVPADVMINNEVLGLSKEIKSLGAMMLNMTSSIEQLNGEVFAPRPAPAPPLAHIQAAPAPAVALHGRSHASARHLQGIKSQLLRHAQANDAEDQEQDSMESGA